MAFRHGAALEAVFLETVPACGTKRSSARFQEAQTQQTGKSTLKVESLLSSSAFDVCGDADLDIH